MIIVRPAEESSVAKGGWNLVYGRRKTGKTFLVEHFVKYDHFFFVKRDRAILEKGDWKEYSYDTFTEILQRDLDGGRSIVIDEFHRLGPDLMDLLHALPQKGRLTLISSTLHMSKDLVGTSSPVLGKVGEVKVGLIYLLDVLNSLQKKRWGRKELVEFAVFLQEPIVIGLFKDRQPSEILRNLHLTVPALIGGIFTEEDRKMSNIYEGVVRATAVSKNTSGEISSFLYSKRLIKKDDPSLIQQYLTNLVDFGILDKTPAWGKNRLVYRHTSPLTRIYYYLDEKYSIGDRDASAGEISRYLEEILPHVIEDALRGLLGRMLGLRLHLHYADDFEIDGIYSNFKKADTALEVKWKRRITGKDLRKAEENLALIGAPRNILLVPDRTGLRSDALEILDIRDLIQMK